jgi:hypothetical protein
MKNQVTTIYKKAERFADLTKKAIITGNIKRAKKYLSIAEQLFKTGSDETKITIINLYVSSIARFLERRYCSISHLFPTSLKEEYTKQLIIAKI